MYDAGEPRDDAPTDDGVRGYGQYCPIARAVEVLGERWAMLIVRDMLCGFTRFNELARCLPGLSRSLLAKRLRQLERAGIVEHRGEEYLLTAAGEDLRELVFGLGEWGARWQFGEPMEDELDPQLLMWWVHRRLDWSRLPAGRTVVEFRFSDRRECFWIVNDAQGPSVCTFDPGFGVDATVETDLRTMYQVWLGRLPLRTAMDEGRVRFQGAGALVRRLPAALELSPIAARVASVQRRTF